MIIDFQEIKDKKPPPPSLKEGDIFSTQGWFVIEELCKDVDGGPICYLRQPRVSLNNLKTYLHPGERERETIAENYLRHDLCLEDSFFKVIVFGEDQVIAVQSTVDGLEIENPYYIEFDPRNVLEIPKKVSYRAAEPLVVNFTPY